MGLTKLSICKQISEIEKIPLKTVEKSVDSFLQILKEKISTGESIQIRGFGSFFRIFKQKRNVWDPVQKKMKISNEKFKISFRTGKEWTEMACSQLSQKSKGD